jgi:hypothetical protein
MKKLFSLIFLLSFLFVSSQGAERIVVNKSGQGPNGYYNVDESHTPEGHTLTCSDPGYDDCGWTVSPTIVGHSQTLYDYYFLVDLAEAQIAIGNLSGTIIHNNEISIVWSGTATNYQIIIDDV